MAIRHGTAGADTLTGTSAADQLSGEAGNDVLRGLAGADTLDGGRGRDTADYGGSAAAVDVRLGLAGGLDGRGFQGDAKGDVLLGVENLVGSAFDDFLFGNAVGNRLGGGDGDDFLESLAGADTLLGGAGHDTLRGGLGADAIVGGAGLDTADYLRSVTGVTVDLTTGLTGGDEAAGDTFAGVENLDGSEAADRFVGTGGANILNGEGGNDALSGLAGADLLAGGFGADSLAGGAGADRFFFLSTSDSPAGNPGRDAIFDFRRAEGDLIDLRFIDASAENASPDDAFEFLGKGPTFDAPGQVEYVFEGGDTVVRLNTAGAGAPEMEIRLVGQIDLAAGDFLL